MDVQLELRAQHATGEPVQDRRDHFNGNLRLSLISRKRKKINFEFRFFQLVYSLNTGRDYGTILCWASNSLGRQREPCVFHLIPAGEKGLGEMQFGNSKFEFSRRSGRKKFCLWETKRGAARCELINSRGGWLCVDGRIKREVLGLAANKNHHKREVQ